MNRSLPAGLAGLVLALTAALPADAASLSVRVEGQSATLLPAIAVEQPTAQTAGCAPGSASASLDVATNGNWDRSAFIQTILGETHDFSDSDYWSLWVFRDGRYVVGTGSCDQPLLAGDEALYAYTQSARSGPGEFDFAPTLKPSWITGLTGSTRPGATVTVKVNGTACRTVTCDPGDGVAVPLEGATVAGGAAPATTGADGTTQVTLGQRGAATLTATAPGAVRSAARTCVTDGADGFCGTTAPDGTTLPPEVGGAPIAPVTPAAVAPAARDTSAPAAAITGIREQQRFSRKGAPRRLTADVADPSGVLQVKLALTRKVGKRCWSFSGTKERFVRVRCGTRYRFKLEGTGAVDYLLPGRLGKGRYVFDVLATDTAYNRDELARGRNRVVFTVR